MPVFWSYPPTTLTTLVRNLYPKTCPQFLWVSSFTGDFLRVPPWLEHWIGSRSPGHHPKSLLGECAPLRFAGLADGYGWNILDFICCLMLFFPLALSCKVRHGPEQQRVKIPSTSIKASTSQLARGESFPLSPLTPTAIDLMAPGWQNLKKPIDRSLGKFSKCALTQTLFGRFVATQPNLFKLGENLYLSRKNL